MKKPSSPYGQQLQEKLKDLRRLREKRKVANRRPRRSRLTAVERAEIIKKTGAKCHICGGDGGEQDAMW